MPWAPDYLTLAEGRDYLRVPAAFTGDDAWIGELITGVSRAIDTACHRQFGSDTVPRAYEHTLAFPDVQNLGWWLLVIEDLVFPPDGDPVTVTVGGTALAGEQWTMLPRTARHLGRPATALRLGLQPAAEIATAGTNGWHATPAQVKNAARVQLGRWYARRQSPAGIAGSPSDGTETRLLDRLDADVALMLSGLVRTRWPR